MTSRLRRAALAAALVAAGPLALPSAAAACPGVKSTGRWSSIDLPPVPAAVPGASTPADGISSYAVAVGRPKLLYAAGGRQVFRSGDGGCSWQVAVSLDTAGSPTAPSRLDQAYTFVNVIVPAGVPGAKAVYALATDWTSALTVNPPVVLAVSRDDGATWRLSQPSAVALVPDYPRCSSGSLIAGADPQAVYLSCPSPSFVEGVATLGLVRCSASFYVSRDDGTSWMGIEPGVTAGCPSRRWSSFGTEPATVADPRSPGWLWGLRTEVIGGSLAQRLMLSTDDGRTVKDLFGGAVGDEGRVVVSARPDQGPRRVGLYLKGGLYLSTDGGATATKLPPVPGPVDSKGAYVGAFFDPAGSALYALTSTAADYGQDLVPYRYDLRSGSWTVLPPRPASKENPLWLGQFRTDNASPVGLYALASGRSSSDPRSIVIFR